MNKFIFKIYMVIGLILAVSASLNAQQITSLSDIYSDLPNIATCKTGSLKQSEKDAFLTETNFIRTVMGLAPVQYDATFDKKAMDEALIIVANMNDFPWGPNYNYHLPASNWHCYTADAAAGGASSNLFYTTSTLPGSLESLNSWLNDKTVNNLGHRRWLLDPFIKKIAFGRSDGTPINGSGNICGMTYYYDSQNEADLSGWGRDFIAFPYGETPPRLWDDSWSVMSFTIVADKGSTWGNKDKISFRTTETGTGNIINNVVIEVIDSKGNVTTIDKSSADNPAPGEKTRGWDYDGYGIPNCLIWQYNGLKKLEEYTVNIKNVRVNGVNKNYTYKFTLRDPSIPKPNKPILQTPANHATNVNPAIMLQWDNPGNVDSWELMVSKSSDFSTNIIVSDNQLTTNTYSLTGKLEPNTVYYWKLRGTNGAGVGDWSDVSDFTTMTGPPQAVLTTPANGSTDQPLTLTLQWQLISMATSYELVVSTAQDFSSTVFTQSVTTTSYVVPSLRLLPKTTYYWKVRGVSSVSGNGTWSDTWSFTTSVAPPTKATLSYPPKGQSNCSPTLQFVWNASSGATSYNLQVDSQSDFPDPAAYLLDVQGITSTVYKVPEGKLDFESQYFWRVQSVGPGGTADWTDASRFRTGPYGSVSEFNSPKVYIYPNPVSDIARITLKAEKPMQIRLALFSTIGKQVALQVSDLTDGINFIELNCTALPVGMYYYRINGDNLDLGGSLQIIR